jgi:hypothetical protein
MSITSTHIFGFNLLEPVTVLTNVLISAFCLYFYLKLNHLGNQPKLKKYWRLFFLFFGISAILGGIAHGFKPYFEPLIFYYVWLSMNLTGLVIAYYLLCTNLEFAKLEKQKKQILYALILFITVLFSVITLTTNNFLSVKINGGIAVIISLITHFQTYRKGMPGSGYISFGFAFSLLSIVVHSAQFSISEWFNYKDISHVIMNISLYFIFVGVTRKLGNDSIQLAD